MSEGKNLVGISKTTFIAGLLIVLLASSAVSAAVTMNYARGPKGDKGDQGETGAQGAQGSQGERGFTGTQGPQGSVGPQGLQGEQGSQGLQGEQGLQGPNGTQGPIGERGPQGIQGFQGPPGVFTIENMSGFLPKPAYDSGWTLIPNDQWVNFTHGLNTTDLFVYVIGKDPYGISQSALYYYVNWEIFNPNEIAVQKSSLIGGWNLVRVMLWKISS